MKGKIKCEVWNDSMQNWKSKPIQKAQLIIADVPYNVGTNFYGSNPMWYKGGDNKNGESKFAGKAAFASDFNFNLYEYFHFCSQLMKKEHPEYETTGGYLKIVKHKADRQTWWDGLSADDKQTVISLPNFDTDVFYECTGIRVKAEDTP